MTPDEIKTISGVLTAIGFLVLLRLLQWQRRAGVDDEQGRSAFLFLLLTTLIVGQIALSYLSILTFGNTERGPFFYLIWLITVIYWGARTERYNGPIWRRIKAAEREGRQIKQSLRKPLE